MVKSHLQSLPQELRDKIFKLCLRHDEIIVPHPSALQQEFWKQQDPELKEKFPQLDLKHIGAPLRRPGAPYPPLGDIVYAPYWPSVALLGVSKTVREDCLRTFFGCNTFRAPTHMNENLLYNEDMGAGGHLLYLAWTVWLPYTSRIVLQPTLSDTEPILGLKLLVAIGTGPLSQEQIVWEPWKWLIYTIRRTGSKPKPNHIIIDTRFYRCFPKVVKQKTSYILELVTSIMSSYSMSSYGQHYIGQSTNLTGIKQNIGVQFLNQYNQKIDLDGLESTLKRDKLIRLFRTSPYASVDERSKVDRDIEIDENDDSQADFEEDSESDDGD